ncbi:MAG: hypothetical protein JWN14_4419 [Chthonomonadales bacterium]|nr:hypothetical protein [Chthonomonadales bacterium]
MRTVQLWLVVLLITFALSTDGWAAPDPRKDHEYTVTVLNLPHIILPLRAPDSPETAEPIKNLISRLVETNKPDLGFAQTMTGFAESDEPGSERNGEGFALGKPDLRKSSPFLELVHLGPKAIPYLLASLDDKTPTKLTITHVGVDGEPSYGRALQGNPGNHAEMVALGDIPLYNFPSFRGGGPKNYTVTRGDVCFVILGQIVSRRYSVVQYKPGSGSVIYNSPTHDPVLAKTVRDIWNSPNPEQRLLDSLLVDYSSHGIPHKPDYSLEDWYYGSRFQVAAILRLLCYFPDQTAPMISDRLRKLKVSDTSSTKHPNDGPWPDDWYRREVANGARTDELIKASAWCSRSNVRSAIAGLFMKTEDPEIGLACLSFPPALETAQIKTKLQELLKTHSDDPGPYGNGCHLLAALSRYCGAGAKSAFHTFLRPPNLNRTLSAIYALQEIHFNGAVDILAPLLADKRNCALDYSVKPHTKEPRLPIRVCDEAADTLAMLDKNLTFHMEGTHAHLDAQIRAMRSKIKARKT